MSRVFGIDFGTTTTAFMSIDTETEQYNYMKASTLILDEFTSDTIVKGIKYKL